MGTAVIRHAWTLSQKRKGTQVLRQTKPETVSEGRRMTRLASSLYWGKPAVRNEPRGWRNRQHDLMAICHDARKGRYSGSHWSNPARLRFTRPVTRAGDSFSRTKPPALCKLPLGPGGRYRPGGGRRGPMGVTRLARTASPSSQAKLSVDHIQSQQASGRTHHKTTILPITAKPVPFPNEGTLTATNNNKSPRSWGQALLSLVI